MEDVCCFVRGDGCRENLPAAGYRGRAGPCSVLPYWLRRIISVHPLAEITIPYPTGKKARWIAHTLPLYVRAFACYHVLGRKGEVKRIANRKPSRSKLDQQILQAAILAVERLQQMLQDENASNGDVIKAASLIFDRLQEETGEGKPTGDFEIIMKEDT